MIFRCDLVPQYEMYREEIDRAIRRVLQSGRYILGEEVETFESEFAGYLGIQYAVGVANGTDGLTLALRALDIGPGDEVITTPFTAIPTGAAIVDAGARPVFVDVHPETFLLDLDRVAAAVTNRTRAVMPVHIFGNVIDVPRLRAALPERVAIIEDASQSHGSTLGGVQSGTMGDLGVFSFYPTKNLGGYGDGGIVVTKDADLARRVRLLRMYGMTDKDHTIMHGVNSRLDELQAAVLRVKLKYLDGMNAKRNEVARRYHQTLNSALFVSQRISDDTFSNYHVFAARCRAPRHPIMAHLTVRGIQTNVYYPIPLHLQQAHSALGMKRGALPVAESICDDVIALPMYAELTGEQQQQVVAAANECAEVLPGR